MFTQVIGKHMPNGQAGAYARQPDMIVNTHAAGGTDNIPFGVALVYDGAAVVVMGEGKTAADFVGVAAKEVKTSVSYYNQKGEYAPTEAVAVFQRGCVNVICQKGVPALGGKVYVRVKANATYADAIVGGFEAEADGNNTVELTNCQWGGVADPNKVAELKILTLNKA
jgi:hypothetical protein